KKCRRWEKKMFQNINAEYEDTEQENQKVDNKVITKNKIKELFKIQNIVYYILCLGASMVEFTEGVSPFGLALIAATCSNKMPVGVVYISVALGTFLGLGKEGLLTYILISLVFITFSLIYRPKYENTVRNEKRKLGAHLI